MLIWLLEQLLGLDLALFGFITFRTIMAALTALVVSLAFGPWFIRYLTARKLGQPIREVGPRTHFDKAGTPTMGGALILISILVSTLIWAEPSNRYVWTVLFVLASFGAIGFVDDFRKLKYKDSRGLSAAAKYGLQSLFALIAAGFLYATADVPGATTLLVPFFKDIAVPMGIGYVVLGYFVIVGSSNAVNLTDGLDGLAIMPVMIAAATFGAIAYFVGNANFSDYLGLHFVVGTGELLVFTAALIGGGLGFLWYNAPPAAVFMGDTGSLALGGALGAIAVCTKHEIVLAIVGGLFVVEALSVIIQVLYFKRTGKRVFLMAPIHHHFEKKGWAEPQIVIRFWIIALILAMIGLATLKVR